MDNLLDILMDSLLDTVKLLPYLLITFIILELIEHKLSKKSELILMRNKKYGPVVGSLLGAIPQCGFGVMAANLFSIKAITIGTIIAVFLSTSDEMLPIMISEQASVMVVLKIIGFKILIGILIGIIVDMFYKNKKELPKNNINHMCHDEHCSCESEGIIISSIKHTLKIGLFILGANIIIGLIINTFGEDKITNILTHKNVISYFLASLVGLIPNCASSVIMTKLYLSNIISTGLLLSGLLTGSGLGILLLFKTNKNIKENIFILLTVYITGVIVGLVVDLVTLM